VAIVWLCPLTVDAYADAGRAAEVPRPDCPSCAGPVAVRAAVAALDPTRHQVIYISMHTKTRRIINTKRSPNHVQTPWPLTSVRSPPWMADLGAVT
jgi:hypothetical protein